MEKYFLISMALFVMIFTSCKKEDNSEDNQKLPVPVSYTKTSSSPLTFSFGQNSFMSLSGSIAKNTNTTTTTTVTYDKRIILKKTISNGTYNSEVNYYYKDAEKGILDSIVHISQGSFNGTIIYTTNNDDKYSKIEVLQADRTIIAEHSYTYNGDKVSSYSWKEIFYGNAQMDVSGNVNYTGDNVDNYILSGTFDGNPVTLSYQYTYDDKNYKSLNVTTQENAFRYTHNITDLQVVMDYMGQQSIFQTTHNYTYDAENYPVTDERIDGNGTTNTAITYDDK